MAGNGDGDKESAETLERLINLGHLSSGVGHHVINAFAAVVSNAELMRLDLPVAKIPAPSVLADRIIQTALDAATVARRLIDYTRPVTSTEPDRAAFQPHTLSLDQLAADFVAAEKVNARPEITWETNLTPLPSINGHEVQLRSMLGHLVKNAYEAIPASGGTIAFSTSTDARGWNVLEIRDTGHGMDPRTLERAVEPFFSTRPGHLGVGLSIANGIWRRHRGTISIHSNPQEGTRVRLCVEPSPG